MINYTVGDAYYFYKDENAEIFEFGHMKIEPSKSLKTIFTCELYYFFGDQSYISGSYLSTNQFHGQNFQKNIYTLFYENLNEFNNEDRKYIIQAVFSQKNYIFEIK